MTKLMVCACSIVREIILDASMKDMELHEGEVTTKKIWRFDGENLDWEMVIQKYIFMI